MAYGTVESTTDGQSRDDDIQTSPSIQSQSQDLHPTSNDEENPLLSPDETGQKLTNIASVITVLLLGTVVFSVI